MTRALIASAITLFVLLVLPPIEKVLDARLEARALDKGSSPPTGA